MGKNLYSDEERVGHEWVVSVEMNVRRTFVIE
jgi:hypothetical protein